MTDPRFLKIEDVVAILNVSARVVRTLLKSRELHGIQVGGRGQWRIDPAELDAYIARQYEATRTPS